MEDAPPPTPDGRNVMILEEPEYRFDPEDDDEEDDDEGAVGWSDWRQFDAPFESYLSAMGRYRG
jgi:hypothetical protein